MKIAARILTVVLAGTLAAACSSEGPAKEFDQAGGKADQATVDGWKKRIDGAMTRLRSERPEFVSSIETLEPRMTRIKKLRFISRDLADQDAAVVLFSRFLNESDPAIRAALAEALPRTGARFADAAADLVSTDEAPEVRVALAATFYKGEKADAHRGLIRAMNDREADVRLEAIVAASRRTDAGDLGTPLRARLADDSSAVVAAAAMAIGMHRITGAENQLAQLAKSDSGEVRLQAVRALSRLDTVLAAQTARSMQQDSDPRVARLANQIVQHKNAQ